MAINWSRVAGAVCIFITYASLGTGLYFFVYRLAMRWAKTNLFALYPAVSISVRIGMAIWSHLACWLGDPGFVAISTNETAKGVDRCKKCSAVRSDRTHHCSACNRCVERMDHHCPWINQCVGKRNHKAFLLFLAYTCSAAIESLILVVVRAATCPSVSDSITMFFLRMILGNEKVDHLIETTDTPDGHYAAMRSIDTCNLTMDYAITGVLGTMTAFLFTIFIAVIAADQLYTIRTNQTHVEFLKGTKGPERSIKEALAETFGMEPSLWWLVPVDWRFTTRLVVKSKHD